MTRTTTRDGHRTARLPADERRRQFTEEAAGRFYRYGFHQVSLAEVARAVGLTAPAVYRHFRNKNALLAGAIESGLDVVDAAFATAGAGLDDLSYALADAALDRRDLWVLLQREMRHLDGEERRRCKARFADLVSRISERVRLARADADDAAIALLVTAILATLASPSVSKLRIPQAEYRRVLAAAACAAARAELPSPAIAAARPAADGEAATPRSRGEQLLETAIELFHERGYAAVILDDIGAEVGLAGPSIYHHFATKSDLLVTAFTRAAHGLAARRTSTDPDGALDGLVRAYIDAGVQQRHLFGVYVTEAVNLPKEAGRRIQGELDANVEEWSAALAARRPELTAPQRLALVHAARGVVNDVVRVGHLHARPRIAAELEALLRAVLDTEIAP